MWRTVATFGAGLSLNAGAEPPLRMLVPVAAGGTADAVARTLADHLRGELARTIVIDNRAGATGRIAGAALKAAAPDGNTVLLAPLVVPVLAPLVFKEVGYVPARDFAPIAQVSTYQFGLAVAAHHPARDVGEFIAWARANPAHAQFGTPGAGSIPHFVGASLARAAGTELTHVAYKGAAQVETEVIGGQVPAMVSALPDLVASHRAGKLRILATSGAQRSPLLPAVATLREQGYPIEALGWHGVYAPAGAPQSFIDRMSGAIVKALANHEVRSKLLALGVEPTGTTPQGLSAIMAADTAHWRAVIRATGFVAE
jgi:tripartite-type tricarboxylate transporter receptor subunit TctC